MSKSRITTLAPAAALCAVAGACVGGFGAYAYYSPPLRPLAHTLGMWLLLAALVSAGRPLRHAILFSTTTLTAAVPAFYIGKAYIYGLRHDTGFGTVDPDKLLLWLALALLAGPLIATIAHRIGTHDRPAALATATTLGLVTADTTRRALTYPNQATTLLIFLTLAAITLWLRTRPLPREHLPAFLTTLLTATALGYLLVSTPDLLEDLLG